MAPQYAGQRQSNLRHDSLVIMETLVSDIVLITQNIDGLHQQVGSIAAQHRSRGRRDRPGNKYHRNTIDSLRLTLTLRSGR